jgi:hypothetical protein
MNALLLYWKPLAIVCLLGLVAVGGYRAGGNSVRADYAQRAIEAQRDYIAALAKANAERDAAIAKHTELQATASAQYQKLTKERQDAEDKLAHAVTTGQRKLFVLAKCPTVGDGAVSSPTADPSGTAPAVAVELARGTADDLVRYGRRVNTLQAAYSRCYTELENDRK